MVNGLIHTRVPSRNTGVWYAAYVVYQKSYGAVKQIWTAMSKTEKSELAT